jgi:hypothetical protein
MRRAPKQRREAVAIIFPMGVSTKSYLDIVSTGAFFARASTHQPDDCVGAACGDCSKPECFMDMLTGS